SAAPEARPVWPIGHQAARIHIYPIEVDSRQLCPQRRGIDLSSIGVVQRLTWNNQCIGATLERLDSGRDVFRTADFNYDDSDAEPARHCLNRIRLQRCDRIADMVQDRHAAEFREEVA